MFEDGYFKRGRRLKQSVIDYAVEHGLIRLSAGIAGLGDFPAAKATIMGVLNCLTGPAGNFARNILSVRVRTGEIAIMEALVHVVKTKRISSADDLTEKDAATAIRTVMAAALQQSLRAGPDVQDAMLKADVEVERCLKKRGGL